MNKLSFLLLGCAIMIGAGMSEDSISVVEGAPGYNCWPMIQPLGERMVCIYTIGREHNPGEKGRSAYARYSDDGCKSWSERILIDENENYGTSSIGKGQDKDGNALFWIRRMGAKARMALYRTRNGQDFELISTPSLDPLPMQITDIYHTPEGLECMWFSDDYNWGLANKSWGTLVSKDNGLSWKQRIIEKDLPIEDWPTEPSVIVLGEGRLLAIARCEAGKGNQFQLTSNDWGKTWEKKRTNISDVRESTPTLIYDKASGKVYNYYYHRGPGLLKLRTADAEYIFDKPLSWPEPEIVAKGGTERPHDSGNANAVAMGNDHFITFYSGDSVNCNILVAKKHVISKSFDGEKRVDADSKLISYTGRILQEDGKTSFDWSGVTARIRFKGTRLRVNLSDTKANYFNVWIDQKPVARQQFMIKTGSAAEITLAKGLEYGVHEVILQKRTEAEQGRVTFHNFSTDGEFVQASVPSTRLIEFIGDSYTCGYGTESASRDDPFLPETENCNLTYAAIAGRYFDADIRLVCHSGMGIARNYNDSKAALMTERILRTFDEDENILWTPQGQKPNVVVIYLGTNDFSCSKHPSLEDWKTSSMILLDRIRSFYGPEIPILMVASRASAVLGDYVRAIAESRNDDKLRWLSIQDDIHNNESDLGASWHPNYAGHRKVASCIIPYISTLTGWEMPFKVVE